MGDEKIRGPDDQHLASELKVNCAISTEIFGEATYRYLGRDVAYFVRQAQFHGDDVQTQRRYARAAIVFLAFHFESVSNVLAARVAQPRDAADKCGRDDWPKPLKRLWDTHKAATRKPFPRRLEVEGVRDLFLIRNKLVAHPAGRAEAGFQTDPKTGKRCEIRPPSGPARYNKLTDFPVQMSALDVDHAVRLVAEVYTFLRRYRDSIGAACTDRDVLGACSAEELAGIGPAETQ